MPLGPFFDYKTNPHVVVVTGGLTGIGRAIALAFISHHAFVVINCLSTQCGEVQLSTFNDEVKLYLLQRGISPVIAPELSYQIKPGDISLPQTGQELIEHCVSAYGHLDTFVSNAGICRFEEFLDITSESVRQHIDTNLGGSFYAVQAAARQMVKQSKGGSIIGISSISALVGGAQQCHYTPTKAGINSLMQSCAAALGKHNIRCNALLPGTIRTALNDEDLADEAKRAYMEGKIPLGRLGRPEDLAGPALFLAVGELSGYVTGAALLVDGGAFVNFQ